LSKGNGAASTTMKRWDEETGTRYLVTYTTGLRRWRYAGLRRESGGEARGRSTVGASGGMGAEACQTPARRKP
jgi:hypothetical protein